MMVDIAMSYIRSNIDYFLDKHRTNPNDLEQKNPRIKQSTLFRIQSGATKDPRRSALEPFAEWAGVSVSDLFEKDFRQLETLLKDEILYITMSQKASDWSRNYTLDVFEKEIKKMVAL